MRGFKLIVGVFFGLGGIGLLVYADELFFKLTSYVVLLVAALIVRNELFPGK